MLAGIVELPDAFFREVLEDADRPERCSPKAGG
jgi:hypothetical protein